MSVAELGELCGSSDSGVTVGECWCAECGEVRHEVKREREILEVREVSPYEWVVVTD